MKVMNIGFLFLCHVRRSFDQLLVTNVFFHLVAHQDCPHCFYFYFFGFEVEELCCEWRLRL